MFHFIEEQLHKKNLKLYGVEIDEIADTALRHRALICLLRGLMIFIGTYGTLIGLLQAFELPYNPLWVIPSFLAASVFVAFLYYNKIIFYLGYFFLLGFYTFGLVYWYLYANSGYQAIINQIYSDYSDYFKLLAVREGQELVEYREVTISVAIIFMGVFLALLLNVTISGYMNVWETMLITLPFPEIALFINKKPPLYCICMMIVMYIFVGILQASRHQRMQVKGKHTHEYMRFTRKNNRYYFYQGNFKGNVLAALFAIAVAVLVGILALIPYHQNVEYGRHNPFRAKIEDYAKIYVQSGFTAFLNRYDNVGGMSAGRIGGVGEVRPDFETDLSVTFAPYSFNSVYLKGFTGSTYSGNQFYSFAEGDVSELPEDAGYIPVYHNDDIKKMDSLFQPEPKATARMNIVNIDADPSYSYLPYYADYSKYASFNKSKSKSLALENGVDITYNPDMNLFFPIPENYNGIGNDEYEFYVNHVCTKVPDDLSVTLQNYIAENNYFDTGLTSLDSEVNAAKYENINEYRLAVARKIYSHYVQDFKYTMAPGTTPANKDAVEYFLEHQKRGYCAHFASAGTLLLRSFGIPARYVEGYVIPPSLLAESGTGLNEDYDEWYDGESLIDEKGVINIEVNDSYAHAWIEIYLDGYGFVPFEMTPPSDEDGGTDLSGFATLFSGLFNVRMDIADLPEANTTNQGNNFTRGLKGFFSARFDFRRFALPLLIAVGVLTLGLIGFYGVKTYKYKKKMKELYTNGHYGELVYIKYTQFTDYITSHPKMRTKNDHPLPEDVLAHLKRLLLNRRPEITEKTLDEFFAYVERAQYAPSSGSAEEYHKFLDFLAILKETLKKLK